MKTAFIGVRVTPMTKDLFQYKAQSMGLTLSELLEICVYEYAVTHQNDPAVIKKRIEKQVIQEKIEKLQRALESND